MFSPVSNFLEGPAPLIRHFAALDHGPPSPNGESMSSTDQKLTPPGWVISAKSLPTTPLVHYVFISRFAVHCPCVYTPPRQHIRRSPRDQLRTPPASCLRNSRGDSRHRRESAVTARQGNTCVARTPGRGQRTSKRKPPIGIKFTFSQDLSFTPLRQILLPSTTRLKCHILRISYRLNFR